MEPVEWIVVNDAPRPTVFATIQSDQWSIMAETTDLYANLSVLQHTFLILTCVAGYPVFWHNDDGTKPYQTRTYNPFIPFQNSTFGVQMKNSSNSDSNYEIPPIARYEANLTMANFTGSMEGVYYCQFENSLDEFDKRFKTEVNLTMKTEPDTSIHGEVIQAGFDETHPQITHMYRYWNTRLSIPFIYGIPPNATLTYALFTIDPDQEWTLPQPQLGNDSKTLQILDFLEVEQILLSPRLGQAIVTITRGSHFHMGYFYFIIRTNNSDGAAPIEKRQSFYVFLDTISSEQLFHVEDAEQLTPFNSSVILTYDEIYEARLYFSNPDWISPRLSVFEQIHQTEGCGWREVTRDQIGPVCGVVAFSRFYEEVQSMTHKGLQITMYAKNPCILTITFDSIQKTDVVSASLYTVTLDMDIFEFDRSGAKLIANPPLLEGDTAFTNESIIFQCLMPKCHLFYIVWHVRSAFYFPCKYDSCPADAVPNADITFSEVTNLTVSINARFSQLQVEDSGFYACALVAPSSRNQDIQQPSVVTIDMHVKDPIAPVFSDGLNFETFNQSFKEGTSLLLPCKVDGLPKPDLTWRLEGSDFLESDFNDNSTFEVSKPGIYICNATNKYGWNSRTYNIQYDKPDEKWLPFVISIPLVVVLFALTVLVVWWIRRRALQASFRELAKTLHESTENIPLDESTFLNDQVQFLQYNRNLEIDRSRLTVTTKLLGIGEFGSIYKGELMVNDNGEMREVAVKLPRDSLNLLQFRSLADELKIMSHIRAHVNVLHLVGACTQDIENRQLFVLTEFCENGSLKDYLAKNFMKFEGFEVNSVGQFLGASGSVEALLKYGYQAANGMAYLAAEKIIHRDLALRNLLLTKNHIVKISDFGMSRRHISDAVYKKNLSDDTPVPIFWMALESLAYAHYTKTSDVWSFGIVLWEMFSCGKRPYPSHAPDVAFRQWLMQSEEHRMRPPNIACDEIYQLMLRCWKSDPEARPSFSECKRSISRILEERSSAMYQSMLVSLSEAWLTVPTIVRGESSGDNWENAPGNTSSNDEETFVENTDSTQMDYEIMEAPMDEVESVPMETFECENKLYMDPVYMNQDEILSYNAPEETEIGYNVSQVIV